MSLKLYIRDVLDFYSRENFKKIEEFLRQESPLSGFRFFDIETSGAVSEAKYYHGLGFVPQDVIRSKFVGTGVLTFDYDLFDSKYLVYTTTGPCRLRGFVGTYREGA